MNGAFHPLPLVNRLLTIAQTEAAKNGHVIESYGKVREVDELIYTGECRICHATVRIICSAHRYDRTGTAYTCACKPG